MHQVESDVQRVDHTQGLPSKPVLEMALNLDVLKTEVTQTLAKGLAKDIEYVLLKVAMELQDKANMLALVQPQNIEQAAKMQKLRFKRYSEVFKLCHEMSLT